MLEVTSRPTDLARRLARRRDAIEKQRNDAGWLPWWRETYIFSRREASLKAREWLEHLQRSAFITEMESWRELDDGRIEFTIRRVPSD